MKAAKKPCQGCPWRLDRDARDIPNFDLDLAEHLANTCPDARGMGPEFGAPLFGCHESIVGKEFACAGWLAACGSAHPIVRLAVMSGKLDVSSLQRGVGWPALHSDFQSMMAKLRVVSNGQLAVAGCVCGASAVQEDAHGSR